MPRDDDRTAFDGQGDDDDAPMMNGGAAHEVPKAGRRFKLIPFDKITLQKSRAYIVRNVLPAGGLIVIWGPPKCGKSFWTFDLVMHAALGWDYRGRRVQRGTVVYIACEGERGLGARVEAFRQARLAEGAEPPLFYLLPTRLDLVADVGRLIADIAATIGDEPCVAIVVDTLNRSIAGSESRDEDMSAYVKAADRLREAFQAAVIVVHHCGVNGDRPRGHTSLTGAADAQIAVKRDDAGKIIATVEEMKDGPEGDVIASTLAVVELDIDEDGETITSCVVEPAEAPVAGKAAKPKGLTAPAKVALGTLRKAATEAGTPAPASNHIPKQATVVPLEIWRRYHKLGTASDGQTEEARKKEFQRARTQLQAAGAIALHDDLYWIVADV